MTARQVEGDDAPIAFAIGKDFLCRPSYVTRTPLGNPPSGSRFSGRE